MNFVGSSLSTRLFRTLKEAGRTLPEFSDDDVLDYMVVEAVVMKAREEEAEEKKKAERRAWRQQHKQMGRKGS